MLHLQNPKKEHSDPCGFRTEQTIWPTLKLPMKVNLVLEDSLRSWDMVGNLSIKNSVRVLLRVLKKRASLSVANSYRDPLSSPSFWNFISRQEIHSTFLRLFSGYKPTIMNLSVNH